MCRYWYDLAKKRGLVLRGEILLLLCDAGVSQFLGEGSYLVEIFLHSSNASGVAGDSNC